MTAPDATQMTHCRDCAHRLGSGCGCECCPWAGDAVAEAAQAIGAYRDWAGTAGATDEALARESFQAALPGTWAAAAAAERERLLNGPVARIEPDPDQPGYNRGVFDVDAAIAQAVAAERERIIALAEGWEAAYEKPCDKPGHLHTLTTPFADLLRAGPGLAHTTGDRACDDYEPEPGPNREPYDACMHCGRPRQEHVTTGDAHGA